MIATATRTRAEQLEMDFEIDQARIQAANWQRALDHDLRALQDYVHHHQTIVWRPREYNKSQEVHLATSETCTCTRYKLRDHCEHIAFVQRLESTGKMPDMKTPVAAWEVQ